MCSGGDFLTLSVYNFFTRISLWNFAYVLTSLDMTGTPIVISGKFSIGYTYK